MDAVALDQLTIRGDNIRYYLLPDTLPLENLLIDDVPKKKKNERGAGRGARAGRGGNPRSGRGRGARAGRGGNPGGPRGPGGPRR